MKNKKLKLSIKKSGLTIYNMLPIIIGVVLIISFLNVIINEKIIISLFTGNSLIDSFIGTTIGSILAGNPIISYIIGNKLLEKGISLLVVTSFMVAWVTVGIIQLPVEISALGRKFAIIRNITAFLFSIIVSIITIMVINLI